MCGWKVRPNSCQLVHISCLRALLKSIILSFKTKTILIKRYIWLIQSWRIDSNHGSLRSRKKYLKQLCVWLQDRNYWWRNHNYRSSSWHAFMYSPNTNLPFFFYQRLCNICFWFFQTLKTEKKGFFGPIKNLCSFLLRNMGEKIHRLVFGKFMKTCHELNNR